MATKKGKLTAKQVLFMEFYLQTLNGGASARAAGYSGKSAYDIAYENLRKPEIMAAIAARLKEAAMTSDEVLARVTDQARGNLTPFFRIADDGHIEFDFGAPGADRFHHLLKKVSTKRKRLINGKGEDAEEWEHEWQDVEIVDSQAALFQLGKHHRLWAEGEVRNELVVVGLDEALEKAWSRHSRRNSGRNRSS